MCSRTRSSSTAPRSFSAFASGRVLPCSAMSFSSSIFCVTTGRAWLPDTACAWAEPNGKQQTSIAIAKEKNLSRQGMRAPFVLGELARAGGLGQRTAESYARLITEKDAANNGPRDSFRTGAKNCLKVWPVSLQKLKDYGEGAATL